MPENGGNIRLRRLEFAALYIAVPAVHVALFDRLGPFIPFVAIFLAAAALLAITPGFRWRSLIDPAGFVRHLPATLLLAAICGAITFALAYQLVPYRVLSFPRNSPDRFLLVIALYPFLSVLGQEIAYRLLFFERYRGLFRTDATAIVASAAVFALAHLFYQNWVAVILSFGGGIAFAWSYVRTSSFPLLWILHSLVGQILFASGLGVYFYHGAIPG